MAGTGQDEPGEPRGATVELVERHLGERHPYSGPDSVVCPNHLRINGIPVLATYHYPVTVQSVELDGSSFRPFAMTFRLLARAVRIGGQPTAVDRVVDDAGSCAGSIVEIPDVDEMRAGDLIDRPYVWLNGARVYIKDGIRIREMTTGGEHRGAAVVTLARLVRRLVVDDEPIQPAI